MTRLLSTLSEQLRAAILNAPMSRYRIARETALTEASLSRFVNGLAGLNSDSIDKLGALLGLRLVSDAQPKPKKG